MPFLSRTDSFHYSAQLITGIGYYHQFGIAHKDLKPENLLVDVETKTLKIADFGLATR